MWEKRRKILRRRWGEAIMRDKQIINLILGKNQK